MRKGAQAGTPLGPNASPASFEDKRKENFDKGQEVLEKRRQSLIEEQKKIEEERKRKEKEEAEAKEKQKYVLKFYVKTLFKLHEARTISRKVKFLSFLIV